MKSEDLLELNERIEELEEEYIEEKLDYETKKAKLLLETDFPTVIGKAKPTVAEKDSWVKLQCKEEEENYKHLGVIIGSLKRKLDILLKFVGDE